MKVKTMFSNKINTQDLFYSNPMDHFLGSDGGLLNSVESGFGSSHSYSQSKKTKDFPITCSEDIFNQSLGKSGGESQVSNLEYQKYISQNLLFGKRRTNEKFIHENKGEPDFKKDYSSSMKERHESHSLEEIKSMLAYLNDEVKQLNTDTSSIKEAIISMKKECSSQTEKVATYEDIISNQSKMLKENENFFKRVDKKEKGTIGKLLEALNEQAQVFKDSMDELNNSMYSYQNKILDSLKRYSAAQTSATKKTMDGIKNHGNQIIRAIERYSDKICSTLDNEENVNKKIVSQTKNLHTLMAEIKDSLTDLVESQKISKMNSVEVGSVLSKHQNGQRNLNLSQNHRNPSVNGSVFSNRNSVFSVRAQNISYPHRRQSLSQSSVHTPLVEVVKQNSSHKPVKQYSVTSQIMDKVKQTKTPAASNNSFVHNKEYSRCTKINVKRKCLTPKNVQRISKEKNTFDDYPYSRPERRITRQSMSRQHEKTRGEWPLKNNAFETNSVDSSQYLTVYEAAMAEYTLM